MPQEIYVEIDCPPGKMRPDDILKMVLKNLEITIDDFIVDSKSFGSWTFKLNEEKNEIYKLSIDIIKERIINFYRNGLIRYASY